MSLFAERVFIVTTIILPMTVVATFVLALREQVQDSESAGGSLKSCGDTDVTVTFLRVKPVSVSGYAGRYKTNSENIDCSDDDRNLAGISGLLYRRLGSINAASSSSAQDTTIHTLWRMKSLVTTRAHLLIYN